MRVGVVGAGAAGLCAIKHSLSFGCDVIAFEQTENVGGTWVYSELTGDDKHGNGIHSSMYEGLRTNLPKELMAFPDFPFPPGERSFITASEVHDYLNSYADTFELRRHIRFEHHVERVRPLARTGTWELVAINHLAGKPERFFFDILLVCNGHFSTPDIPQFEGAGEFLGTQLHSHDYRKPDRYMNRNVLTIGGGPSGVDISQQIASVARKVLWSNHLTLKKQIDLENLVQKPDVARLTSKGAVFVDGSFEPLDDVVYCTGYQFTFPFLSDECSILCEGNYVRPLFKQCLNINHPSMAMIGLPFYTCPFQLFDIQLRFCLTFMTGRKVLPSKEDMLNDTDAVMKERWQGEVPKRKAAHGLGSYQKEYFRSLAEVAGIEPLKPVVLKMYDENRRNQLSDKFSRYRDYKFTVIDDEDFEVELSERD